MESVQVSLITTFHNEATNVPRFFTSLREWTRLPDEIIMVDGGSTDETVALVKEHRRNAPTSVALIEAAGCNISEGRNIAIRNATHDVIASTDLGCVPEPNWLARLIAPLEEDDTVDMVGGYYLPICRTPFQHCYHHLTYKPRLESSTFLPSSRSLAFRRWVWEGVGGYPEHMTTAEDTLFDLTARKQQFKEVFAPDAIVHWEGRDSYRSLFRQNFRYAWGAGTGLILPWQYAFYWANYLLFGLWALLSMGATPWFLAVLAAHLLGYAWVRIFRKELVRRYLSPANLVRYLCITFCIDLGCLLGYPAGVVARALGRHGRFRPPDDRGEKYGSYWDET